MDWLKGVFTSRFVGGNTPFLYASLLISSMVFSALASSQINEAALLKKVFSVYQSERAVKRVKAWRTLVDEQQSSSEQQKLAEVNAFFNQLHFVDDIKLWGKADYWATPVEFLGVAGGDCEDFSIAKYFTLTELGVAEEKLRLVYVKALSLNQFHMVVAYYPEPAAMPLILDNLDADIKPANQRKDLAPVYSFNGKNLWLMKEKGRGQLAGKASRLKSWNELRGGLKNNRMNLPLVSFD
ncbi:transglutaminase-like cysteine peptidase [Motilimonas sp. E26]|uniref:transglutaminase-like cysteine peptidase n=1 Tax=Motilimonas TaxID=1914248 RepID=UPI001E5964ED|nr:transglutaminase-like cysteine peptidase [Motilimonas sp. E26]